jgi:hypothetical protein
VEDNIVPNFSENDNFVFVANLSALLREKTGDPGPGHRKLVQLANDARTSPPMRREGRFWGCDASKVPDLVRTLLALKITSAPTVRSSRRAPRGTGIDQTQAAA